MKLFIRNQVQIFGFEQTDEEEMGTTYDKIDAYIKGEPIPERDKQIIDQLHDKTEHKRNIPTRLRLK